jgi:hypothetical protein
MLVLLLLVVANLLPLAYASPADQSWVAGIYDAADYDDVVWLVTNTTATQAVDPAGDFQLAAIVGPLAHAAASAPFLLRSSALHSRAPPVA